MTRQRVFRAIREVAPYMVLASIGCFIVAGLIGSSVLYDDRTIADRILLAVGWASYAAGLYVLARYAERNV